ncbi:hypothetical protein BDZ90DRAFT_54570 [Jaminaea rosea]|uniref:Uncharacterized protein n=1 Tax=Jaminaea rosea TaxID=1569628 RepID=A0A316ULX2_9BASI|nr:hypothetical protein BDZ90DRAFT_54570 [Jaminaea rosea]PWN25944.1 hypothetical protein BDZ90DRAFT_54570 [Jaminaea rosea]
MKRMTNFLSSDKSRPATASTPVTPAVAGRKSDDGQRLELAGSSSPSEQSFGVQRGASPAPGSAAAGNLATIPESRQQAYFDLPTSGTLPMYSAAPRTPMAFLSPHPTGQTTMSQSAGPQSVGQMGAVQYLAAPVQAAQGQRTASSSSSPDPNPVDRADLHRSLKSLETLLAQLDEYRDLQAALAKCEKKLFKSCAELAKNNKAVVAAAPASALQHSAAIFEAQHEVTSKHAKMVQKEYEALNEACAKYFKKVAKEERTHEDLVQGLEIKVRKVQSTYDGKKAQSGPRALEAHDRYIATMSSLTNDIAKAKTTHASSIGVKSHSTALLVASAVGGLAEASFRAQCETVRRSGPNVGPLAQWVNFCSSEAMPSNAPIELSEEEVGVAAHFAVAEAQAAEAQRLAKEAALHQVRSQAVGEWKHQQQEQQQQYAALAAQSLLGSPQVGGHQGLDPSFAFSDKPNPQQQTMLAAALPRLDSSGKEVDAAKEKRDFRLGASYNDEAPKQSEQAERVIVEEKEEEGAEGEIENGLRVIKDVGQGVQRKASAHSQHSQAAEPTMIDHGPASTAIRDGQPVPRKSTPAEAVSSSSSSPLSSSLQRDSSQTSGSANGSSSGPSGTGSAISSSSSSTAPASPYPRTPDEGDPLPSSTAALGGLQVPPAVPEESEAPLSTSTSSPSMPRMASPKPLRPSPAVTPTKPVAKKPGETLSPSPSVKHRWEQERERALARQRETELERRLQQAEDRLRFVERANPPPAESSRGGGGALVAPSARDQGRMSPSSYESSSQAPRSPRTFDRYDDRSRDAARQQLQPPSRPTSQLYRQEAPSSVDGPYPRHSAAFERPPLQQQPQRRRQSSTESERSFVARMKAHYQAEKFATTSTAPSSGFGRRGAGQDAHDDRDHLKRPQQQNRRATMPVAPSVSPGEFGQYRDRDQDRRPVSPYDQQHRGAYAAASSPAPPRHSDICGCQSCSARHYATDSVKASMMQGAMRGDGGAGNTGGTRRGMMGMNEAGRQGVLSMGRER